MNIAYDPRLTDLIYLVHSKGEFERCTLLGRKETFQQRDWYEARDYFELQAQKNEAALTRTLQSDIRFESQVEHLVRQAREATDAAHIIQSNQGRTKAIRANRQQERDLERELGAAQLRSDAYDNDSASPTEGESNNETQEQDEKYTPTRYTARLRKHLKGDLGHDE